jgi:fructosamine-3-kinase
VTLPAPVRVAVERELTRLAGRDTRVVRARTVGGGCISPGACIETDQGDRHFVKWALPGEAPAGLFTEEARSLRALNDARAVRVPQVRAAAEQWLLLEWLESGSPRAGTWESLGRALAALHGTKADAFGWDADNFIGTLPQPNGRVARWWTFWAERRLLPQFTRARQRGLLDHDDQRAFDRLLGRLEDLLSPADADGPSLLHGDLWGGNVHVMENGTAALIDPSSYHGHREVDLAMAELFGGFGTPFLEAYREAWPLAPGYDQARRELYQLYYVLVHVNLFGAGYVAGTRRVLQKFGG